MALTVRDLSPDQKSCFDQIIRWSKNPSSKQVLSLGGYAGTGKTTVVSLVAEALPAPIAFCAFTGKASSVLKRKLAAAGILTVGTQKSDNGVPSSDIRPYCGTIHSLIYRPCDCREPQVVKVSKPCPHDDCRNEVAAPAEGASETRCAQGHAVTAKAWGKLAPKSFHVYAAKGPDGRCPKCREKGWLRRDVLDRSYSLIIVDEASMVDDTMLDDLSGYGIPILAVGDHGQLPPVRGTGSLMKRPDLRLEKIHRQAADNPIIALSCIIRETGHIPERLPGNDGRVTFAGLRAMSQLLEDRYSGASPERLLAMGLATATNRRRVGCNELVRRIRRTNGRPPRAGEHVVCLKNMKTDTKQTPIYNGMRGVLASDADFKALKSGSTSKTQLRAAIGFPDDGIEPQEFDMLAAQFAREKTYSTPEDLARETGLYSFAEAGALFDFGYAMTCHKMQGSQYEDLVVIAEKMGPMSMEDWTRWQYTAVTRAAERLTILR